MPPSPSFFEPSIPNPYPERFDRVSDLRYVTRLVLAREPVALQDEKGREASYIVAEPYTVEYAIDGRATRLTVPKGMLTDLVSVPWGVRNTVGRVGPHLEAAIVHDFLYIAWQLLPDRGAREADWRFANAVMFAGLRAADVGWLRRRAIEVGLRFPGVSWSIYRERDRRKFVHLDARYASVEDGLIDGDVRPA